MADEREQQHTTIMTRGSGKIVMDEDDDEMPQAVCDDVTQTQNISRHTAPQPPSSARRTDQVESPNTCMRARRMNGDETVLSVDVN